MVSEPSCGRIDLVPLGQAAHRSFHHEKQLQATDFHVPVSGQDGMGNRRHVNFVKGNVGIHLPSIPSGSQSIGQDQRGTNGDRTSCAMVAKTRLVTRPSGSELGAIKGASTLRETAVAAQVEHIPSESADAPASHTWRLSPRVLDLPNSQRMWLRGLPEANFTNLP